VTHDRDEAQEHHRDGHDLWPQALRVRFWLLVGVWSIVAVLALGGIASIPGNNLDLYFSDRYVPISKISLAAAVMVGLVLPLLVATIRHLRPPHR
jgi:hypothetical protein